jgi:hypothetical protein
MMRSVGGPDVHGFGLAAVLVKIAVIGGLDVDDRGRRRRVAAAGG